MGFPLGLQRLLFLLVADPPRRGLVPTTIEPLLHWWAWKLAAMLQEELCGVIQQLAIILALEDRGDRLPVLIGHTFAVEPLADGFFRLLDARGEDWYLKPPQPFV